jgi:6-phosphogluconate dehydrogenase
MRAGHTCVVYDRHEESIKEAVKQAAKGTTDLKHFVGMLAKPRAVCLMMPAAAVDKVLDDLVLLPEPGDLVVDGGNSYYHDDNRRAAALQEKRMQTLYCTTTNSTCRIWLGSPAGYPIRAKGAGPCKRRSTGVFPRPSSARRCSAASVPGA